MRHRRFDLNQLPALNALLSQRNVTRAAETLNLSQSAMSGILARLREAFDDPLLVRSGRTFQLTSKGASLVQPTRDALERINALLASQAEFEPATARRHFVIAASDYTMTTFLNDFVRAMAQSAPGLSFSFAPGGTAGIAKLDTGDVDFAVTPAHLASSQYPHCSLFQDGYLVVAWTHNRQLGEQLSLGDYTRLGHVLCCGEANGLAWFEQWYQREHGDTRRVEVKVHSFNLLPQMVLGTDRIATVQSGLARRYAETLPLRLFELPLPSPQLKTILHWNRRQDGDPAIQWLRGTLVGMARQLTPPPQSAG